MPGFEWIDEEEKEAVTSIFDNGGVLFAHGFDGMRNGIYHVREFEGECAQYFKAKHCLAVSSGTAAIKVALKAIGIKPGDEVITQAFNFIATVEAILDCGAVPIISNVDQTLNLDPLELSKLTTNKTKAILPVHMLGVPAEMDPIISFANKNGILIVEDNCESVGAKYNNKFLGTIGDAGAFSFDQGKVIATGEGGMVLTDCDKINKKACEYHDHGHENNPDFPRGLDTCSTPGFNYRMTEMQAAVGKVQLKKLDKMLRSNIERYSALGAALNNRFSVRAIPEKAETIFDTYILFTDDKTTRENIISLLQKEGFGTKNLPDAINWHCAYHWSHALTNDQILHARKTLQLLEKAVAIPIWRRKSPEDYEQLGSQLRQI